MSSSSGKSDGTLNLNSKAFDSDTFVSNLILRKGLDELVTIEEEMVQSVRRLDYEMQHLVYENYNKFLTATNTVRKMQTEFGNMDNQMETLSLKIDRISELSTELTAEFATNRWVTKIGNLADSNETVKTLQSLVRLPDKLRSLIEENKFLEAGRLYKRFRPTLDKIRDFSAVQGIYRETTGYVAKMERQIWLNFENPIVSSEEFISQAKVLLEIGVESQLLKSKLTEMWSNGLENALSRLEKNANNPETSEFPDILNFVDNGVCPFLADISLVVSLHNDLFSLDEKSELMEVVKSNMKRIKTLLTHRFEAETDPGECALYVKSLDRVHRKINACCRMPGLEFHVENTEIVLDAAHHQIQICRKGICANITNHVKQIRDDYDVAKIESLLLPLIGKLEQTFVTSVKSALANLLLFTASDVTILKRAESERAHHSTFGVDVHEQVVAGSIRDLCEVMEETNENTNNHEFSLLLSMVLYSLTRKNTKYLMDLCQEQYKIEEDVAENLLTRPLELMKIVSSCALKLLEKYVDLYCLEMYEVFNSSAENWNEGSTTPTDVRKETLEFMKQIRKLDQKLQLLLDDSAKKERTPESIRNSRKLNLTSPDHRNFNSAIERMWAETVEDFAAPALEFRRHAILGCLVDKSLRLFLNWVRGRKFSRVGVQQLQIDSFYFKQNLWKFVADEMCMNVLIDETLSAAVNLCVNPLLLQPPAVKEICDRHGIRSQFRVINGRKRLGVQGVFYSSTVMDLRTQLCDPADNYVNDPNIELQWAMAATQKAKIHTNLLLNSDTRQLKLCKDDDRIAQTFRSTFPDLQVREITIDDLKGTNVEKWRTVCSSLNEVKDFNFGALLRLRADRSYSDENTVLVPYVIFLAIEIARNREGVNEDCKSSMDESRNSLLKTNESKVL